MTKHLDPMHPDNEHRADLSEWLPASAIPSPYKGDERLDERTPGFVRLPKADTFPALGELPVHGAADAAWLAESQRRIDEHEALQAKRAFRMRKFSTLTDAEVKEVMAYDLTPRALQALRKSGERTGATVADTQTLRGSDIALLNALAGDGPVEQLRPPPVPETTTPAFKMGVLCGLLVGSGVMAALPYIVELLK